MVKGAILKSAILIFSILLVSFFELIYLYLISPNYKNINNESVDIEIPKGSSLKKISSILYKNNLISNKSLFDLSVKIIGSDRNLQAGKFSLSRRFTPSEIIGELIYSRSKDVSVTVIEGLQARQIAQLLKNRVGIDSLTFMHLVNDSIFTGEMGIYANSLEGYLFPETYNFYWGVDERTVIGRMVAEFKKRFVAKYERRAEQIGFTVHQIVTLASIIEGEAVYDEERGLISAVYHNRLKKGMRLQADPTIQYLIPDGPRRLYSEDLRIDSPYNTYRHKGLPPGPINNPGWPSILSALYPAEVNYLYFVARGDGYHIFSKTNREHINAKIRLKKLRRLLSSSGRK